MDFVKTRKIAYYIVLGFTILAFIAGIIASAGLSEAGVNALPAVFTLIGLLAFLLLSVIGQEKFGAGTAAFASFISLVTTVCQAFEYFLAEIQGQAMVGVNITAIKGMTVFIACAVIFVACSVVIGVCAWLKLSKKKSADTEKNVEEIKHEG